MIVTRYGWMIMVVHDGDPSWTTINVLMDERMDLEITLFKEEEHLSIVPELTELLHEAYKSLADSGLSYSASYQAPEKTLQRLKYFESYLAYWKSQLVGTISLMKWKSDSSCEYYRREGSFHFGQFGISPAFKGNGFGNRLLEFVEKRAEALGGKEIALDTAEKAADLIAWYERHGYRRVSRTKWASTNYESIVMAKKLG